MSNVDQWSMIVGALLPPALAIVQQEHWSKARQSFVAFVACLIAAIGTVYFAGNLQFTVSDSKAISSAFLVVLVTAMATYSQFWKPTGIAPTIERLSFTINKPAAPAAPPAGQA